MTREGIIALEEIDTNCNACKHFVRDLDKMNAIKAHYEVKRLPHSYGRCDKKGVEVKTPNGNCTPYNAYCWETRRL